MEVFVYGTCDRNGNFIPVLPLKYGTMDILFSALGSFDDMASRRVQESSSKLSQVEGKIGDNITRRGM